MGNSQKPSKKLQKSSQKQPFSKKSPKFLQKPFQPAVNPESFPQEQPQNPEILAKTKTQPFSVKILAIMPPFTNFHGYTIKKLRDYCENRAIYSVISHKTREKLHIFQEKFATHQEINEKLRALNHISRLSASYFAEIVDFFVEVEEIQGFAFFYVNIVRKPAKMLSLEQIFAIFRRKPRKSLDEQLVWRVCRVFLEETRELFEKSLFLSSLKLQNLWFRADLLKKTRRIAAENKQFSQELVKILGKGLLLRAEVLFFNRLPARKSQKTAKIGKKFAKKLIESQVLCFEPTSFRTGCTNTAEIEHETQVFSHSCAFFNEILAFLSNFSKKDRLFSRESALAAVESLEFSQFLKDFLRLACDSRFELPRSLQKICEKLDYFCRNSQQQATVERAGCRNSAKIAEKLQKVAFSWIFQVFEDFLLLVSLGKRVRGFVLNLGKLQSENRENRDNYDNFRRKLEVKACAWSVLQENVFYLVFARKPQDFSEKLCKLTVDFAKMQAKADEPSCEKLVFCEESAGFLEEVYVFAGMPGFSAKMLSAQRAETLIIAGFDAFSQKICLFSLSVAEKKLLKLQEVAQTPEIVQFGLDFSDFWLHVRRGDQTESLQVFDSEKNLQFSYEIDENAQKLIENCTNCSQFSAEIVGKPQFLRENRENAYIIAQMRVFSAKEPRKSREITLIARKLQKFSAVSANLQDFRDFFQGTAAKSRAFFEDSPNLAVFSTFIAENREVFLDFFEFDGDLCGFSLQNSRKLGNLSRKPLKCLQFCEDCAFSQYRLVRETDFCEEFEAFDEISCKTLRIFKQIRALSCENLVFKGVFPQTKQLFAMFWPDFCRKFAFVPENLYISADISRHCLETWLFVEKKTAKNLYEYLISAAEPRFLQNLGICREIVKSFAKMLDFQPDFRELLQLDRVFLVFSAKKQRFLAKFAVLSQENCAEIRENFALCEEFSAEMPQKRLLKLNELLFQQKTAAESLGILLFFVTFPEFPRLFEPNLQEIKQFLEKKRRNRKFFDERAADLLESLLFPAKIEKNSPSLAEIAGKLREITLFSQKTAINHAFQGRNLLEKPAKPAEMLVFLPKDCDFVLKFNVFSQEIRRFPLISRKNRARLSLQDLQVYTISAETLSIFAFFRENSTNCLHFCEIPAETPGDSCIFADFFPKTAGFFEDFREFAPTGLYFLRKTVYQIGGICGFLGKCRGSQEMFSFSLQKRVWSRGPRLSFARETAGITSSAGNLLVFGNDFSGFRFAAERLRTCENRWETLDFRGFCEETLAIALENARFLQKIDENAFLLLNLRRNSAIILKEGEETAVLAVKVRGGAEFSRFFEEKTKENAFLQETRWLCEGLVVGNRAALAVFCENGWLCCANLRESRENFELFWETEFRAWPY